MVELGSVALAAAIALTGKVSHISCKRFINLKCFEKSTPALELPDSLRMEHRASATHHYQKQL